MTVTIVPLHSTFAAQAQGVSIAKGISDSDLEIIAKAIDDFGMLVLRGQDITNEEQIKFAENFGVIEPSVTRFRSDNIQRIEQREIVDVSNLDENNKPRDVSDRLRMLMLGNRLWHTDSSFRSVPGALSMLLCRATPPDGGNTEFSDTRTAYDKLPDNVKSRIDDFEAEHSLMYSREQLGFTDFSPEEIQALPPVRHRIVRQSPADGRKALYIGSHASHILGLPLPEGRMQLRDLLDHATQREFIYSHSWKVGDLVIWDNRCTLHRGMAYDESHARDLRRVTTSDTAPISVLASVKSAASQ